MHWPITLPIKLWQNHFDWTGQRSWEKHLDHFSWPCFFFFNRSATKLQSVISDIIAIIGCWQFKINNKCCSLQLLFFSENVLNIDPKPKSPLQCDPCSYRTTYWHSSTKWKVQLVPTSGRPSEDSKQSKQSERTALITSARSARDIKNPSLRSAVQLQVVPLVLSLPPQNERPRANKSVSHFPSRSVPPVCLWNLLSPWPPCHCLPRGLASGLNPSATHLSSRLNEKAKLG